jgi:hypothetical protein
MAISIDKILGLIIPESVLLKINDNNLATDSINPKRTHGASLGSNKGFGIDSTDLGYSIYELVESITTDLGLGAGGAVQTLSYNAVTYDLSISGANTVSLATLATGTLADAILAADDATGDGGVATTGARSDHKHAAQGVSTDALNSLTIGSDGLHFITANAAADANAISPAADDFTGAVGVATGEYALEDHKHPAQGVSADANNILVVGTDGLHQLPLDASGFDGNLATSDDTLQEVAQAFDDYLGNDRLFADDTTVSPAVTGSPTVAEITTFAGTNRDTVIYYNGTDVAGTAPTYVYHIDKSGNVTQLEQPSNEMVTNDQATSGYMDFGAMRMQWGIDTSAITGDRTITLPVAFANANYTVTSSVERATGTGMGVLRSRTTADFVMQSINGSGTGIVDDIHFYAIGLKP